jgi:hypothetical protein
VIADDRLILTLHNQATLTIPCRGLSAKHHLSRKKERTDIFLSDDWHEITWPQIDVRITVNDLLQQWLIQPSLSIDSLRSGLEQWLSPEEKWTPTNPPSMKVPEVQEVPGRRKIRQFKRSYGCSHERRLQALYDRIRQLESIVRCRNTD